MTRIPGVGDVGDVLSDGLEGLEHNFITSRVEDLVKWSRARSCWPATFGLACCAIEMMATGAAHYDLARYGMEVFRASPRQADLMIVAGRVSQKMAPILRQIYDQMMEPKWVISMGSCANSGGMYDIYSVVQGVDKFLPVDVYVSGCPPRPEALLQGLILLQESIGRERRPLSWVINDQGIIQKEAHPVQREVRGPERIAATELRSPDQV